jgi:hypothetical protein
VPNFFEPSFLPGLQNQRPDVFMAEKRSYIPPFKVGFTPDHAISGSYAVPLSYPVCSTLEPLKRLKANCLSLPSMALRISFVNRAQWA